MKIMTYKASPFFRQYYLISNFIISLQEESGKEQINSKTSAKQVER